MNRGAFDFEAWEWVNPRACGLMWGVPGERQWHFVVDKKSENPKRIAKEALEFMATLPGNTKQWWAHNGGKYDVLFLLEALQELQWKASIYIASGRVVSLKISGPHGAFTVQDSYSVVPSKLSIAADSFQLKSRKLLGEEDYKVDVRRWSLERLETGCRADCEVTLELLDTVETLLQHEGGELKATFSASAFSVVAAKVDVIDMRKLEYENRIARLSYHGGRVEVFKHTPSYVLSEWDINSSYPASMRRVLPWEFVGFSYGAAARRHFDAENVGTVEATVSVPEQYLPVLPWRHPQDDGLFFPTGTWRGWFAACELRYAVKCGSAKVVDVHGFMNYTARQPFESMIDSFYAIKSTSTGAKREFYKLCLNGSYGKFAQKPEKEQLYMFPTEEEALEYAYDEKNAGRCKFLSTANLRFLSREVYRWSKQTHFAVASYITAYSRILLHRFLSQSRRIAYADTDSVHAASDSDLPCSSELGALKLERQNIYGVYAAPKIYSLEFVDGSKPTHYALKGFPVDAVSFDKVVKEGQVQRERMALAKSQLRKARAPSRIVDSRAWSGRSMKRRPVGGVDGDTAPWSISELMKSQHMTARSPVATSRKPDRF